MIVDTVVTEHAERAALGWTSRSEAVHRPDFNLADLKQLDQQITQNLHALSVAGPDAWPVLVESLDAGQPASVFTAAAFAVNSGDSDLVSQVLETVTDTVSAAALASAAAWMGQASNELVRKLMLSDDPVQQHAGLAATAVQRHLFPADVLRRDDVTSQPRFLKGIGELGCSDLVSLCTLQLQSDDVETRFRAAWSATLLGHASARNVLMEIVVADSEFSEAACALIVRGTEYARTADWLGRLASNPDRSRLAVITAGAIGDPVLVSWLIECMASERLTRAAGEAFSMITGVDLEHEDLTGDGPEDSTTGEDAAAEADEGLPWPDPELIQQWWGQNQGRFTDGRRYLAGYEINEDNLWIVIEAGRQRQRAAAAIEMALLEPGKPLFNVAAHADHQAKLIHNRQLC